MSELMDRRCFEGHDVEPHWILVCGNTECVANIIADETECNPYIATLQQRVEALERLSKYARHHPECAFHLETIAAVFGEDVSCTCGLTEALAASEKGERDG